jgi:hypothetical protein
MRFATFFNAVTGGIHDFGVGVVFLEVLSRFVSHILNLKHQVEDCKDSKVF